MKSTHPTYSVSSSTYGFVLGQFLNPDIKVQAPENTQSYNRYAYCFNNPMKYTDPSGFTSYYVDGVQVPFQEYRLMGGEKFTSRTYGNSSYLFDFGISKDKNTAPEKAHARLQRVIYLPQDHITGDGSELKNIFVLAHLLSCFVRVKNAHVHAINARQLGAWSFFVK